MGGSSFLWSDDVPAKVVVTFFQSPARLAGRALQRDARVEQLPPDKDQWFCTMVKNDDGDDMVVITGKDDTAAATCTCTDFASGMYCKHIWATLVDIDSSDSPATDQSDQSGNQTSQALEALVDAQPQSLRARKRDPDRAPTDSSEPQWSRCLNLIRLTSNDVPAAPSSISRQQLCYIIRPDLSTEHDGLVIELQLRRRTTKGWTQPKPLSVSTRSITRLSDPEDRPICAALTGGTPIDSDSGQTWYAAASNHNVYRVTVGVRRWLMRKMIQTGRCYLAHPRHPKRWTLLHWDDTIEDGLNDFLNESGQETLETPEVNLRPSDQNPTSIEGSSADSATIDEAPAATTGDVPADLQASLPHDVARPDSPESVESPSSQESSAPPEPASPVNAVPSEITDMQDPAELATSSPWVLWFIGRLVDGALELQLELRRDDQTMSIEKPVLILGGQAGQDGLVFYGDLVAGFDDQDAFRWVHQFREDAGLNAGSDNTGQSATMHVDPQQINSFIERLFAMKHLPQIDLPEQVGPMQRDVTPQPCLELFNPSMQSNVVSSSTPRKLISAAVFFDYEGHRVNASRIGRFVLVGPQASSQPAQIDSPAEPDPKDQTDSTDQTNTEAQTQVTAQADSAADADSTDQADPPSKADQQRQLIRRDNLTEQRLLEDLGNLGFKAITDQPGQWTILASSVAFVVDELMALGWKVLADQRPVHRAGPARFSISSGVDWFDLKGGFAFETIDGLQHVPLPQILAAVRRGNSMVELDDGSQGLIPSQWLADHELLGGLGQSLDDSLRFKTSQAALIDALLNHEELAETDTPFEELRQRIRHFEKIEPIVVQPGFKGDLRTYQEYGLGWLKFMQWFGMGGILADDMGLGKTIQVLAMLYNRVKQVPEQSPNQPADQQTELKKPKPTFVVAPRSVVFNWVDEAAHFTPNLKVLSYRGTNREAMRHRFNDYDLIVTSYSLMRRDIEFLHEKRFEYVVLDEAQMIKNSSSQVAKAARLLQSDHRLALTGTPVENHLGDLWSIIDFLNPGMLGTDSRFASLIRSSGAGTFRDPDEETASPTEADAASESSDVSAGQSGASVGGATGERAKRKSQKVKRDTQILLQLSKSLRPLILRRTKSEVLADLPEKTEQTLICRMEPAQRKIYDNLLQHYRASLLGQSDLLGSSGPAGPTMLVLEALLRLRQAACHPALIDPNHGDQDSAKLDLLVQQIQEVIDEGHKALVFSQFTSLLGLLRQRLDQKKITYEYLDGRTHKRRKKVQRFQTDDMCPLFLISLKAGGFGLNLTAADYVFILDPWWNPAVEQQAIDRAHRIGQKRHVFAYRMICEDTVEQRIVNLQQKKRNLADAIIGQQENLLRALTRDDLKMLLS
jgi:superfamily II DNA or RNA helicase